MLKVVVKSNWFATLINSFISNIVIKSASIIL